MDFFLGVADRTSGEEQFHHANPGAASIECCSTLMAGVLRQDPTTADVRLFP
jgi:hypothetical protein